MFPVLPDFCCGCTTVNLPHGLGCALSQSPVYAAGLGFASLRNVLACSYTIVPFEFLCRVLTGLPRTIWPPSPPPAPFQHGEVRPLLADFYPRAYIPPLPQWRHRDHELHRPTSRPTKRVHQVFVHRRHQRPLGVRVHQTLQATGGQLEGVRFPKGEERHQGRSKKGDTLTKL